MGLHMIYCDTRRDALNELHMQRHDIEHADPANPLTLHGENGLIGKIIDAVGIVNSRGMDDDVIVIKASLPWCKAGCQWAVLVEVDETYKEDT